LLLKNQILGKYKNRSTKYTPEIKCFIRRYVVSRTNFIVQKLLAAIKKKFNVQASRSGIYNILKLLKITRKKILKKTILYDKKTMNTKIKEFKKSVKNIQRSKIISVDETSFDTHITPNYGWSEVGKKITKIQKYTYKRFTIICAVSNKNVVHYKIIKGSANACHFKEFLENIFEIAFLFFVQL